MTAEIPVDSRCFPCLLLCIGILWMCGMGILVDAACGRPGRSLLTIYDPGRDNFETGQKIRYRCTNASDVLFGVSERECLRNGSWSEEIPVCYAACGRPGRSLLTIYDPGRDNFETGQKIRYRCTNASDVLFGVSERECLRNGSWSEEIPVCYKLIKLEEIQYYNEDVKVKTSFSVDGNISTCLATPFNSTIWAGYILSTRANISAVQIVFRGIRDLRTEVIVKSYRSESRCQIGSESTVFVHTADTFNTLRFYCPAGAVGDFIYIRNKNQNWSICEVSAFLPPAEQCLSPDIPKNGNGRSIISGTRQYLFQCEDGYKLWGQFTVTCQANGRWSPKSPICEKIKCSPPSALENGIVEHDLINGKIPYNGTAKYRCNNGYILEGHSTITCIHWDQWNSIEPKCKARTLGVSSSSKALRCGSLPQIANGALVLNLTANGLIALLKCNDGFKPLTDDRIFCLQTGNWSPHSLHCAAIKCDFNPIVPHGAVILHNNSSYYGAHLQILCNPGYTSHETILRKCEKSGTWGDLNVCVEITCGVFHSIDVNHGEWIPLNDSHSLRILVCPEDYHIEGSPPVTRCLSNGSWSYTSASCRSSLEANSWTPNLMLIAAVAIGAGTAILILCLFLAFMIVRKRRLTQANTTMFHLQSTKRKNDTRESNFQDKHSSRSERRKVVELRPKTICTIPRKPHSALPNLPMDTDPVYAQPFETLIDTKKIQNTAVIKKDDLYNAHIYAEPVDSRTSTSSINMPFNVTLPEARADSEIHSNINLQSESSTSIRISQQNCDKKCAIYDSSSYSSINDGNITLVIGDKYESNNVKPSLCTFTNNAEYMGLL